MASQPLLSRVWSCASLKEALAMMDDQILPDDPQELALFVKDLQAKVEETSAAIATADTIPGDVSEDRASEGLMVKEETENASPEHGGQKNVTPEEMTDDEDDDMLFLAFSQFLGSPSPAEEESLLLEDPYMAPPATPPVKETWFSPLGKKSNSEQNVLGGPATSPSTTAPGTASSGGGNTPSPNSASEVEAGGSGTKRMAGKLFTSSEVEVMRGKFRRLCEPKRDSGKIEVPDDIFKQYKEKGAAREKLFEAFIKTGCEKKEFLRTVTLEKSMERSQELEQEGGFYTPEEMKDILGYKQPRIDALVERGTKDPEYMLADDVDPKIVYYWCNVRTKGTFKRRQAEKLSDKTQAEGTTSSFSGEVMGDKMDLCMLGHKGPSQKDEQKSKSHMVDLHMKEILAVSGKIENFIEKLSSSTASSAPEVKADADTMRTTCNKVYDDLSNLCAAFKVGELKENEETDKTLDEKFVESKKLISKWTSFEKKNRSLLRKPRAPKKGADCD